jgi:hypothetical protein
MLRSRALGCVGLLAVALASAACSDVTAPTSSNVNALPRLAPPTTSVNAALTGLTRPIDTELPKGALPADAIFTRWILISGVWIEVEDHAAK